MNNLLNVNLKGDRCWWPAKGMNTLRFGIFWQGPGTNAAWGVKVQGRIGNGEWFDLGTTYTFANNATTVVRTIPACDDVGFVVSAQEASGAGTQDPCRVRVDALLTKETAIGTWS